MRQPPVDYLARTRALYDHLGYTPYRWHHSDDAVPLVMLDKPLSQCRVAMLSSGGVYRRGQLAFHHADDVSFRVIPTDTPTADLRATHFAYDLTDARRDPNVVFPIDTLRSLAGDGVIGGLGPRSYTFMGGIYSTRRVREALVPPLVEQVLTDHVDLALLVPV
ncbi:MAG: glycine/sarcosine/betaine reductase selenoprotein B family protein [Acidimicrobiales bacterium]